MNFGLLNVVCQQIKMPDASSFSQKLAFRASAKRWHPASLSSREVSGPDLCVLLEQSAAGVPGTCGFRLLGGRSDAIAAESGRKALE